jgi:hypothetical protein
MAINSTKQFRRIALGSWIKMFQLKAQDGGCCKTGFLCSARPRAGGVRAERDRYQPAGEHSSN